MSHYYGTTYRANNISFDDFFEVMKDNFEATEQDIFSEGDGTLEFRKDCLTISGHYEDRHDVIVNSLRELSPNVLVSGEWRDIENVPTFFLGDDV